MKCALCSKKLEPVFADSEYQPHDGCEIQILGAYGSSYDMTTFRGLLCDTCVSKLKDNMEEIPYGS